MHTLEDIRQMKNIKHYKPPLKSSIGIYKKKKEKFYWCLPYHSSAFGFHPFLALTYHHLRLFLEMDSAIFLKRNRIFKTLEYYISINDLNNL
jgi:hypothetical protein